MRKPKCPSTVKCNGFEYRLVEFQSNVAIYTQHDLDIGEIVGYEVWLIGSLFRVPKDEDFGKIAWTYKTLQEAMLKVGRLTRFGERRAA